MSARTFRSTCHVHGWSTDHFPACRDQSEDDAATERVAYFYGHWSKMHHRRPYPRRNLHPRWRTPTPRPFVVTFGGIGDEVAWADHRTGNVMRGQVWANHPAPRTRWVADGYRFHAVHEAQLLRLDDEGRVAS